MIVVDSRESKSMVVNLLDKVGANYRIDTIEVGDYIVGDIAIERKEINDYVGSLTSGRLHNQLYNLSFNYPVSVLLIEGYIDEVLMYRKIKKQTYISSLAGAISKRAPDGARGVINMVMVSTPYDTALFLKYLDEKQDSIRKPVIAKKKGIGSEEFAISILSSLPNVSEVRARRLLEHFGSVQCVMNASIDELMEVKGIGESTAKEIHDIIRKKIELSRS